jgi:hypothetical protein
VGRRLSRAGYEINNRQGQFEQRKAFQRLIYLSYSVFGEQKAAFLLPWRRVFNLNDSQLFVARRDNARAIFNQHLREKCDGDLPADRCARGGGDSCCGSSGGGGGGGPRMARVALELCMRPAFRAFMRSAWRAPPGRQGRKAL